MDVDGSNEGLVLERVSYNCSVPGCQYRSPLENKLYTDKILQEHWPCVIHCFHFFL